MSIRRFSILLLGLLSAPVVMADQSNNDLFSMSLEQLTEVTITGSTLTEKTIKTVPSAVTVFTHEQIKRMGLDSLDELMNLVPGFQSHRSSSAPSNSTFSSRGRRIAAESAEILMLVDGQRMSEANTSGSVYLMSKFPLVQIERIEFIRGSGSAVYGSNAMLGVVNIITRSDVNEVSAGYGSFDRYKADVLASKQVGEVTLDFFGSYDTDNGDDYKVQDTFSNNRINTDDPRELTELNFKLHWQNTQINLKHSQIETDNFYIADRLSNGYNKIDVEASSASLKQEFEWQSISSWLFLSYSQSQLHGDLQLLPAGALFAASGGVSNVATYSKTDFGENSELRMQLHNDWIVNEKSDIQFGFEYRHLDVSEGEAKRNFDLTALANGNLPIASSNTLDFPVTFQSESRRDIFGVYSQYQRQLFEQTHLTLGLRYDHFSGIEGQFIPRVGLIHDLNNYHSIKLLYGEAFRAPAENELNLINNPVLLGNKNLKPETVKSWDLIWVAQWKRTNFSLGYFENYFDDSIIVADSGGGGLQYQNATDDTDSKGIEFEASYELNKNWLFRGTYTHIFEQPDNTFREAEHLASLMVNYQQGKWNTNLIATYRGKSEMATGGSSDNRIDLDDQWQLYGKLGYEFSSQWQGFVQIKNLLDEEVLSAPNGIDMTEGVPNRGREIFAGVIWGF
jgi:outer membrane receptor for ferrienterochelin and colicins